MGMFQDVAAMNVAFGNKAFDKAQFLPISDRAEDAAEFYAVPWARVEKQCKNIVAEYKELMDAIAERDLEKVRDALCDINVFSLGAHHLLGQDADADMAEVIDALYSRFCKDEAHLAATKLHYDAAGIEYYSEGEFPQVCLKSAYDQGLTMKDGHEVWEYPQGKFLKAVGYRQPVFK